MKAFRSPTFSERLDTATTAKKAALERFRARPASDDPAIVEQRTARQAVAAARELRAAERSAARRAEEARQAAELAARDIRYAVRKARKV